MKHVDVAIIGAGIVGLASAYRLIERFPKIRIALFEKESQIAFHQSGRNSGVIHSGIYYAPGSHKALNCRAGRGELIAFCRTEGIPFELCGKVVVATEPEELPRLDRLFERGRANGVQCEIIGPKRLREIEPNATGLSALWVPEAGIVDYRAVCRRLAERIGGNAEIHLGRAALRITRRELHTIVATTSGEVEARLLINCAGLHSDRVCALAGKRPAVKIVPFRGEYYELTASARALVRNLIYPVPDPSFPFLGVHLTRTISGEVECGPNAVLAFAREGYEKYELNPLDLLDTLTYSGFLRLATKHWRAGSREIVRSLSKSAFAASLKRLVPAISEDDLIPAGSGIRAQALTPEGNLADDFVIEQSDGAIHVCNAPSPAATSALSIGKYITDLASVVFDR